MKENEICFIMCTNDPLYAEECMHYIRHLHVPNGMQVDVLTVEDAASMASGYNEAMRCSESRYKVYLHHDTFLTNRDFIGDMLAVFRRDDRIGMLGLAGPFRMPPNGIMWHTKDRVSAIYSSLIYKTYPVLLQPEGRGGEAGYYEVEAVDGLLMATRYDLPWREDLFTGWDFYDASQSMEFRRAGYKVVVPRTDRPWCLHDSGYPNMTGYEANRRRFVEEYLNEAQTADRTEKNPKK